ncbi:hypothetical protein LUZ60_009372 [Juncus effusus]|nr:hypothetical protein LUZ60_009372 [Juncus effusus]
MTNIPSTSTNPDTSHHVQIIPGLPDEISLLCLARVPRRYHLTLSQVSTRWRSLLASSDFKLTRQKLNLQETWIYALCKNKAKQVTMLYVLDPDPIRRSWKVVFVVPCPKRDGMAVETLGERLYVLGGCGWRVDASDKVCCFDAASFRWEILPPMPTPRCYFVSTSLNGKLFVTGGLGITDRSPNSWDIYDQSSNSWHSHKNPMLIPDIVKFIPTNNDKLYTIHKTAWSTVHFAGIYNPSNEVWNGTGNEIAQHSLGPTVVANGSLIALNEGYSGIGKRLMVWNEKDRSWAMIGRVSDLVAKSPCKLVCVDRSVYVVGKGFGTVVVFMDMVVNEGGSGMLVCGSLRAIDELMDLEILSCHAITI